MSTVYKTKVETVTAVRWRKGAKRPRGVALHVFHAVDPSDVGITFVAAGVQTRSGLRRIAPGDWLVTLKSGARRVYTDAEFRRRFEKA